MSGFIRDDHLTPIEVCDDLVEVREGRTARIGSMGIVRALPTKGRRTIGRMGTPGRHPQFTSVLDRIEAPTPPWVR